jgi:hypothetical protein
VNICVNLPVKIVENLYSFQAFHSVFHSAGGSNRPVIKLPLNPSHDQRHNKIDLHLIQRPALLNSMPF